MIARGLGRGGCSVSRMIRIPASGSGSRLMCSAKGSSLVSIRGHSSSHRGRPSRSGSNRLRADRASQCSTSCRYAAAKPLGDRHQAGPTRSGGRRLQRREAPRSSCRTGSPRRSCTSSGSVTCDCGERDVERSGQPQDESAGHAGQDLVALPAFPRAGRLAPRAATSESPR